MPNGHSVTTATQYAAIVKKLQAKRDVIAKLPHEKQLAVYGMAFDWFVKPTLAKSGIKEDKDFNIAKDRWIVSVVNPKDQRALPENYGRPAVVPSIATQGSAALVGALAGAEGAFKNLVSFTDRVGNYISPKLADKPENDPWVKNLGEAEEKDYALAHGAAPAYASSGAAVGKAIPSLELYEGAASAIPKLAAGTPMAWRLLARAGRAAVGGAAGALPYGGDKKDVAEQAGVNTAIDLLFGGIGKASGAGAQRILRTVKARGSGSQVRAAQVVDDLLTTVVKEKFGGKTLDKLSPEEFQQATSEAKARRAAGESQRREAAKAVADAKRVVKPSKEQQVLAKAQLTEQKAAARKVENEKARAFHSRLVSYKKRVGSLPAEGSEHLAALKSGKTVEEILGTPEAQAVAAATKVGDLHQAAALSEGSPKAIEAVQVVQSIASKPKPKPEPIFNVDTAKLKSATTPEDFAQAKKDALAEIESQAREKAKSVPEAGRSKFLSEYTAARERVRSHPVPENISKKALDKTRKAGEHSQGVNALADAIHESQSDPESDLVSAIDKSKELLKDWQSVGGKDTGLSRITKAWKEASPSGDLKVFNEMISQAIEAMRKNK